MKIFVLTTNTVVPPTGERNDTLVRALPHVNAHGFASALLAIGVSAGAVVPSTSRFEFREVDQFGTLLVSRVRKQL